MYQHVSPAQINLILKLERDGHGGKCLGKVSVIRNNGFNAGIAGLKKSCNYIARRTTPLATWPANPRKFASGRLHTAPEPENLSLVEQRRAEPSQGAQERRLNTTASSAAFGDVVSCNERSPNALHVPQSPAARKHEEFLFSSRNRSSL